MNKFTYKMSNLFKSKETIELEARMKFNQNKRSFTKYYQELGTSIKEFSKMAKDAELSGNHANAQNCARFILKLQRTQTRVQGLLQRFEMMRSAQRLTGVMSNFMEACVEMGFDMDDKLDLKSMSKNTMALETTLSKLDAMSDQMDEVFNSLDGMMGSADDQGLSDEESNAQATALLDQIMDRHNIVSYPELSQPAVTQPVAAQPVTAQPVVEQPATDESDAIRERLLKMRQELQD